MKKAFVTIFPLFSEALAYKDVGMIVGYLSTYHGYDGYIVSNRPSNLQGDVFHSVKQVVLGTKKETGKPGLDVARYNIFKTIKFVSSLSKQYDKVVINFYHMTRNALLLSIMIKLLFPNVYVYIKLDIDIQSENARKFIGNTIKNKIRYFLLNGVDVLSAETQRAFKYLNLNKSIASKMCMIPNGFFLEKNSIDSKLNDYIEIKEKIIFTAGRLESYQKNTKLLVDSYLESGLWLDGWQLVLAGSYDQKVEKYIKEQLNIVANNHNNCISLTGHLSREQLFSYMRRAKVFALSSRWEGFALVLPEAVAHGCIIAATDVGGVEDVTNNGSLGFIAKEQTIKSFTEVLKLAAASSPELAKKQREFGLSNFDWKDICNKLAENLDEKIK